MRLVHRLKRFRRPSLVNDTEDYLQADRYKTSVSKVKDGCFLIIGQREELGVTEKAVVMAVTESETAITADHINHLLKAGKKASADEAGLVAQAKATDRAQKLVQQSPITVLSEQQLAKPKSNNTAKDRHFDDGPTDTDSASVATSLEGVSRRKYLSSIGGLAALGVGAYKLRDPWSRFPIIGPRIQFALTDPIKPGEHELYASKSDFRRFTGSIEGLNRALQKSKSITWIKDDIHPDSSLRDKQVSEFKNNGVAYVPTPDDLEVLDIKSDRALVRVSGHPVQNKGSDGGPVNPDITTTLTEVYELKGYEGKLRERDWGVYDYIYVSG